MTASIYCDLNTQIVLGWMLMAVGLSFIVSHTGAQRHD